MTVLLGAIVFSAAVVVLQAAPAPLLMRLLAVGVGAITFRLAMMDVDTMRISRRVVWGLVAMVLTTVALQAAVSRDLVPTLRSFIGALVLVVPLLGSFLAGRSRGRRTIGLGDVKLAIALGLVVGWFGVWVALVTSILGPSFGAVHLGVHGRARRARSSVPFVPSLCAAYWVALLAATAWSGS